MRLLCTCKSVPYIYIYMGLLFGNIIFTKCFLRIQKYAYVILNIHQILWNYNLFWRRASVHYTFGEVSIFLTYLSFTTAWTCQFVYSGSWTFFVIMGFGSQVFLNSVIREICYLYIWVSKYISDICGFFANNGKCSQFSEDNKTN